MAETIITTLDVDGLTFVPLPDYRAARAEVEALRGQVAELEAVVGRLFDAHDALDHPGFYADPAWNDAYNDLRALRGGKEGGE